MQNKKVLPVLVSVLALNLLGDDSWQGSGPDYAFGSSDEPMQSCTIASPEAGCEVRSLSFFPALDAVLELSGGTLLFQSGGRISLGGQGMAEIAAPVVAPQGLSVEGGLVVLENIYPQGTKSFNVLERADISQYEVVSAVLQSSGVPAVAYPCNVKMENGAKTLQLQFSGDGGWNKCLKLSLSNSDGNIVGKVLYRRYAKISNNPIGYDFDMLSTEYSHTDVNKATIYTQDSYLTIKSITLGRISAGPAVAFKGTVDVGAAPYALDVATNANVRFVGGAVAANSDGETVNADIVLNGRLSVCGRDRTVVSGAVSGAGVLALEPWEGAYDEPQVSAGEASENAEVLIKAYEGDTSDWLKIVEKESICAVTNVSEVWIRRAPEATAVKATVCRFANDGQYVTFQAQIYDGGYVKCAKVKLKTDSHGDIVGKLTGTPYLSMSKADGEAFLGTDINTVTPTGTRGHYYVVGMTLHISGRTKRREVVLGAKSWQNEGRVEVGSGTRLVLGAESCMPSNGVVTVRGGAELETSATQRSAIDQVVSVHICPGGVLRQKKRDAFAHRGPVFYVDGGELALQRRKLDSNADCESYLNRVVLAGGALASGLRARIGSNIPSFRPAWYVKRGTSAERVKVTCGFTFVGVSRDQLFSIVVDDFAEGADLITCPADFYLEGDGQFAEYNSNLGFTIPVRKAGEGTWFVGASSANYHAAIRIEQGEMIFGVDNGFPNAELISLDGGCLNAASATTQTFQKLKVTKDSTLVIGEGANVQFAAVDAADWTGRLAITGDFRDASPLRIGTAKVLTAQQLGNIRINNRRAVQDDNGYMHPYYGGPVIIVR